MGIKRKDLPQADDKVDQGKQRLLPGGQSRLISSKAAAESWAQDKQHFQVMRGGAGGQDLRDLHLLPQLPVNILGRMTEIVNPMMSTPLGYCNSINSCLLCTKHFP